MFGDLELALFLAAVAIYLVVIEAGFRLGLRHRVPDDDGHRSHVTGLQSALLGLLALLLGFTFAMAVSRYDQRKSLVLEEANAISKVYWRSQLTPEPYRRELGKLLRDYAAMRVEAHEGDEDPARLAKLGARAEHLEREIWARAAALQGQGGGPMSTNALFIQAINDMIDVNEKRRVALENHVPEAVLNLLFVVSAGAIGFIAYSCGLSGRRRYISTAIFATLIAFVLTFIRDMDQPQAGLVTVSQESMLRVKERIDAAVRDAP